MRTPTMEEVRDLEAEIELRDEKIAAYQAGVADLKGVLVRFVEPRQRRRPEVLLALQALATGAGLPLRCPNRRCRRADRCHGEDPCEPACGELWSDELALRFHDMAAGIALSAVVQDSEAKALHGRICSALEAPLKAAGRGRTRRAKRAPGRNRNVLP